MHRAIIEDKIAVLKEIQEVIKKKYSCVQEELVSHPWKFNVKTERGRILDCMVNI